MGRIQRALEPYLPSPLRRLARVADESEVANYLRRVVSPPLPEDVLLIMGVIAARQLPAALESLQQAEFRVFSQFGEDGIVQFLIKALPEIPRTFIEFGVQSYQESNTRFLLMHNAWRGLVIEADPSEVAVIKSERYGWKFGLTAVHAKLTTQNINDVFAQAGFTGRIGLLSIDVDGVDYHLWDAITVADPAIVIIEYNHYFPIDRRITIPYDPDFERAAANPNYYGSSLAALVQLGQRKGYSFVGVESHQKNAFFVRSELSAGLPRGKIATLPRNPTPRALAGLPVLNVASGGTETL